MTANFEKYIQHLQLEQLFKKLQASNPDALAKEVEHFTTKEAEKRDEIINNYFGKNGINLVVNAITKLLLASPKLKANAKILDVGAGTGFFTARIAEKIRAELPTISFYAMDLTPAMLVSLAKKKAEITPFVGLAENLEGSVREARKCLEIPLKFDAIFSTLMLHHSLQPERVFQSFRTVLKKNGRAIVIDLCEHSFEEWKKEMGDVHLGFNPESIRKMALRHFPKVQVEKMPGIRCECSNRAAEIFVAFMQNSP